MEQAISRIDIFSLRIADLIHTNGTLGKWQRAKFTIYFTNNYFAYKALMWGLS